MRGNCVVSKSIAIVIFSVIAFWVPLQSVLANDMDLLRQAAEGGVAEAQLELAKKYETGDGVTKDFKVARKWYESAATQGNEEAKAWIGKVRNQEKIAQDAALKQRQEQERKNQEAALKQKQMAEAQRLREAQELAQREAAQAAAQQNCLKTCESSYGSCTSRIDDCDTKYSEASDSCSLAVSAGGILGLLGDADPNQLQNSMNESLKNCEADAERMRRSCESMAQSTSNRCERELNTCQRQC